MASQSGKDEDQDKPLDPAVERVRRKLVRFVAINLGILFVALMAVVVAVVYRAADIGAPSREASPALPEARDGMPHQVALGLPAGARILGHALDGDRVMIRVELAGGEGALLLHDLTTGRLVGRFDLVEDAP